MVSLKVLLANGLIGLMVSLAFPQATWAQIDRQIEFRIDSKTFHGDQAIPVSANKTLFWEGLIYDFPIPADGAAPAEIVIYDSHRKEISFLDMQRQVQLKLLDLQVQKLLTGMREQMAQDPRSKLLLEQSFEERLDVRSNALTLVGSQGVTYRFFGKPPENTALLPAYFQFLDAFTRSQVSDPASRPPLARIRMNESIRKTGWIPHRVEIKVKAGNFYRNAFSAHSTHQLQTELTDRDRQEIAIVKKNWGAFPNVTLNAYREIDSQQGLLSRLTESVKENRSNQSSDLPNR